MILAGDIGGTNTRLALYEKGKLHSEKKYPSHSYPGLAAIVQEYLREHTAPIQCASFGVAGVIRSGVCKTTNLPWVVDCHLLQQKLSVSSVHLINDLLANAHGLLALEPDDFILLQRGYGVEMGHRALIAAGTGLGEAGLFWNGKDYIPFATEGGHADFAPRNSLEVELLFYLQKRFGHVSYERVVSGPGLHFLYQFLIDTGKEHASPRLTEEMKESDPSRVISRWGIKREDPAATRALDWFVSLYGAEAGNWALKILPYGGFYIGGGIAPHLLEAIQQGAFLSSFCDKGRFDGLLESIPVWIVMKEQAALLGAAIYAERQV